MFLIIEINIMDIQNNPKVSVYISTYNRLDKLKRAIYSVLNQDYKNLEIIICDDASTDGTCEFISELIAIDQRVIYLRNDQNKGACATRNLGIFNATGTYITGLDDDDEFTYDRISFFLKNWDDKYSFICCNFINKYPDLESRPQYANDSNMYFSYKDILFENFASNQIFTLRDRLADINGFDISVKRLQDWDTWLRLSFKYGDFVRFNTCTYIMHHDHLPGEDRVSTNEKLVKSLLGLVERNKNIYASDDVRFMKYLVSALQRKADFSESLYWSIKKYNVKYMLKFFLQPFYGHKL